MTFLIKSNIEYIECKFSRRHTNFTLEVKIGCHAIPQITWFKYLGSIIHNIGEIDGYVNLRIHGTRYMKCRSASSIIPKRKILFKLKGKSYCIATRHVMLYETKCWVIKSQQVNKRNVTFTRILR